MDGAALEHFLTREEAWLPEADTRVSDLVDMRRMHTPKGPILVLGFIEVSYRRTVRNSLG